MADWMVEEVEESCPFPFHSISVGLLPSVIHHHLHLHLWRAFLACVPYKEQPQWNFAPFIFYFVAAACLRYVCIWSFSCVLMVLNWRQRVHKASQSERRERDSAYLFMGISTAPWADLANSIVICLLYEFFKCVLFSVFHLGFVWRLGIQTTTTTNQLTVRMNEENQQKRRKYFSTLFLLLILGRQVNFFTIPEIVPRRHPSKPFTFSRRSVHSWTSLWDH